MRSLIYITENLLALPYKVPLSLWGLFFASVLVCGMVRVEFQRVAKFLGPQVKVGRILIRKSPHPPPPEKTKKSTNESTYVAG